MLAAMNRLPVSRRRRVLPAGRPAALDRPRRAADRAAGADVVLAARGVRAVRADRGAGDARARLGRRPRLLRSRGLRPVRASATSGRARVPVSESSGGRVLRLFPAAAEPFFQAYRAVAHGALALGEPGFRVVVVVAGRGMLGWRDGEAEVRSGETWVVPHGAGPLTLRGDADAILCAPPADRRMTAPTYDGLRAGFRWSPAGAGQHRRRGLRPAAARRRRDPRHGRARADPGRLLRRAGVAVEPARERARRTRRRRGRPGRRRPLPAAGNRASRTSPRTSSARSPSRSAPSSGRRRWRCASATRMPAS